MLNRLRVRSLARNGFATLCTNDPERAEQFFRSALAGAPDRLMPEITIGLGSALMLQHRWAEAATLMNGLLSSPKLLVRSQSQVSLGICLTHLDDAPRAMSLWSTAAAEGPRSPAAYAHVCLGEHLLRKGDTAAARPHLDAALASREPEPAACAHANLGHLCALAGDEARAQDHWSAARRSGFISASTQAEFYMALRHRRHGETASAVAILEKVVAAGHPDSAGDARRELRRIADEGR